MMENPDLPIIDWELATRLAGNKHKLAEELLSMLIKDLPTDIERINQSYQQQKFPEMNKQLHKLHGALCFCGVPRLKKLVAQLEMDIINNETTDLPKLIESLNNEVTLLLEYYSK